MSKPEDSLTTPDPGQDPNSLKVDVRRHYALTLGQQVSTNNRKYLYQALALAMRDRLVPRWKSTTRLHDTSPDKQVAYLSMEFLLGRALSNTIQSLDMDESTKTILAELGVELEELTAREQDAGLGNGGLGRLAACFLDSCASLDLPVTGYGLRYEYGMFRQAIIDGTQVELPDRWLRDGNPWELKRVEHTRRVRFSGHTENSNDSDSTMKIRWVDTMDILAVPYDIPIPGYRNDTVNTLRLWKAVATEEFNLAEFQAGSYAEAVEAKNLAEHITMVLYPNDVSENGKELRLQQQYFLASASLQDVVGHWVLSQGNNFDDFATHHVFQLNDTHPSCAVPELMRILMDDHDLGWDQAWHITTSTMAYTNHTLLPEALERWPVRIFARLLPRLMEIVYEINSRFLQEVSLRWPGDVDRLERMSLIEEGPDPLIRMAYLAVVGSFSVNGVAELHSQLLKKHLFADFHTLWPERFNNKTNGVTHRRWLAQCNPLLSEHISNAIGEDWKSDFSKIKELKPFATDSGFQERWHAIKLTNKEQLEDYVAKLTGVHLDTQRLLDVQVKRIHEYKRQLLNVLRLINIYDRVHQGDTEGLLPRTVMLGGKAAPGYNHAKLIIRLICNVASVINMDPIMKDWLTVVFLPNYGVTAMEHVCPATELSEQISTAGKEASGTGNMKFMMNGALTIGTLDGANIEIRDLVGSDNFFLFGLTADEVIANAGDYDPQHLVDDDDDLRRVLDLIRSDHFSLFDRGLFNPIVDSVLSKSDPWMLAADFRNYMDAQIRVDECYQQRSDWVRMSILNTAASGWFSSDRTISEYATSIWGLHCEKR